ncbi:pyridoxamine 5'-phosphate oxidase family protein [Pedobacter sp. Du54]|uniref:pyridoxamine 5'-phosphate oxidase family protein n=1 Tax=Pedobacter anseongensis TaxID=3133439 RepID=UPI0030AF4E04
MLGELTQNEISALLSKLHIGRLGCQAETEMYIIPINYVYRKNSIYAFSAGGKKIEAMRKNPNVCFQVDEIIDTFRWKSVLLWGKYEEVTDPSERQQAVQALVHRIMPLTDLPSQHPWHGIASVEQDIDTKVKTIVYRILIYKSSGRFELHQNT